MSIYEPNCRHFHRGIMKVLSVLALLVFVCACRTMWSDESSAGEKDQDLQKSNVETLSREATSSMNRQQDASQIVAPLVPMVSVILDMD